MRDFLLDLFFPKTCVNCGRLGNYICSGCIDKYFRLRALQHCHVCKKEVVTGFVHEGCRSKSGLDGVVVCVDYNKLVERLIAKYKYNYYHDISKFIGGFYLKGMERLEEAGVEVVVPVPLHPKKEKIRGFNQSALVAEILSKKMGIKVAPLAKRERFTHSQVGLGRMQRLANLKGAFVFGRGESYEVKNAVLLDDVMTTGATLEECAKVLRAHGVGRVFGIVFSRG